MPVPLTAIPGLQTLDAAAPTRLWRAKFPNYDQEQFKGNLPGMDDVVEWVKPPKMEVPTLLYKDLKAMGLKNDSTMREYNIYAVGSGGPCAHWANDGETCKLAGFVRGKAGACAFEQCASSLGAHCRAPPLPPARVCLPPLVFSRIPSLPHTLSLFPTLLPLCVLDICTNNTAGGWEEIERGFAMKGELGFPVALRWNSSRLPSWARWTLPAAAPDDWSNAPTLTSWHNQVRARVWAPPLPTRGAALLTTVFSPRFLVFASPRRAGTRARTP